MPKRKQVPIEDHHSQEEEEEYEPKSEEEEEQDDHHHHPHEDNDTSDSDEFPEASEEKNDDEIEIEGNTIDVDFEFFDPAEGDFQGIKNLLVHFLDGRQFACSELVDDILTAPAATVIKSDDDPLGVAAIIPLSDRKYISDMKAVLLKELKHVSRKVESFFNDTAGNTHAVLISERLLNCPPQLAAPLMEGLKSELNEKKVKISKMLFIIRVYVDPSSDDSELIFATPEGELLAQHAEWKGVFETVNRPVVKDELVQKRLVGVVEYAKFGGAVLKGIKRFFE